MIQQVVDKEEETRKSNNAAVSSNEETNWDKHNKEADENEKKISKALK